MTDVGLYNYIKNALAQGRSREDIKDELEKKAGWSSATLDEAFSDIDSGMVPAMNAHPLLGQRDTGYRRRSVRRLNLNYILIGMLILIGASFSYTHQRSGDTSVVQGNFISIPMPDGFNSRNIYVVAQENCTREEAKRADSLVENLRQTGIPVVRTHQIAFSKFDPKSIDQIDTIMQGTLPIVFVNGRVASNPSLQQVLTEYSKSQK